MKAERRHELKENELAKDLGKIAQFVKENLRSLATGFVIAVAVLYLAIFSIGRWRTSRQMRWAEFFFASAGVSGADSAADQRDTLAALAAKAGGDDLAAWAHIRSGDLALVELTERRTALSSEELAGLRAEGERAYRTVLESHADNERAVAKAHLGLGRLAETFGEFDAAGAAYAKAAEMESAGARLVAAQALRLNKALEDVEGPVVLARRPATRPSTQPAEEAAG